MSKKRKNIKSDILKKPINPDWATFSIMALIAFVIRCVIINLAPGYSTDIGCFDSWATTAFNSGLGNFYTSAGFSDYPPGYIYVLYIMGGIKQLFGNSVNREWFVKLPAVIADIATAAVVYNLIFKKWGSKQGILCAAFLLFNPLYIVNSSAWGQVDSVFALVLVLSIYLMTDKKLIWGAFVYGIAVLIKPQALMFGPVVLLIYICYWDVKKFFSAIGGGILTIIGFSVPFSFGQSSPLWLVDLYYKTMVEQYKYTTLNAPNLYGILGKNGIPLETAFLGLNYEIWGMIFTAAAVLSVFAFFVVFMRKSKDPKKYGYLIAAYSISLIYFVGTKMHERYIFPVVLLLVFDYLENKDRLSLLGALGTSVVTAFCVGVLLNMSYAKTYYYGHNDVGFGIMSWLNLAFLGLIIYQLIKRFKELPKPSEIKAKAGDA